MKRLDEGLKVPTFRTIPLNLTRVIPYNWMAKIELGGLVYWCARKMLKEIETEETIGFVVTVLSLVAFWLGGPGLLSPLWLRPC